MIYGMHGKGRPKEARKEQFFGDELTADDGEARRVVVVFK